MWIALGKRKKAVSPFRVLWTKKRCAEEVYYKETKEKGDDLDGLLHISRFIAYGDSHIE